MAKFEMYQDARNEYRFRLKAGNGQTILASEGYSAKAGCLNGIESVRTNSQDDSKYDRKKSSNGKHYFNLKASNGQVIGTSEMYESSSGMENGIESVKTNAPKATVEEG
ncbi:YegP family protein [Lacinutrix salivirga]